MKCRLQDLIDIEQFQMLQDRLNEIYPFPSAIIDNDGTILTATDWQDVCTKFHRLHSECERECIKSDQYILSHLAEAAPAVSYRCPHGLVDNALPIVVDGVHLGSFFTGQFFLEEPDLDFFRAQAAKYGFEEGAYIDAVKKVPVWTRAQLDSYLFFIKGLIEVISGIGLKNLRAIEAREKSVENERQFQAMFDTASIGIAQADPHTGQWLRVNRKLCDITGYTAEEMLALRVSEITHPEDRGKDWELFQRVIRGDAPDYQIEKRYVRKDGAVVWVSVNMTVIRDNAGQPVRTMAAIEDITERRLGGEVLRESENSLRESQTVAGLGSYVLDIPGNWWKNSDVLDRIFGIDGGYERSVEGWEALIHPSDRAMVGDYLRNEVLGRTQRFDKEYRILRHSDQAERWVHGLGRLDFDPEGRPLRMHGTIQDITERKQTERRQCLLLEILKILNEKAGLADAISHILTAIQQETGFDAVGIRLRSGDDYPYFAQHGFSDDFLVTEDTLITHDGGRGVYRDANGKVRLECTCGLVISGQTDPASPLFTPEGSFWTNDSLPLLDLPCDKDPRFHPRNRCIHEGFLSIALIPIRTESEIVGLLQLNDRKRGRLTIDRVNFFQEISASIGVALAQKQAVETLRASEELLREAQSIAGLGSYVLDLSKQLWMGSEELDRLLGVDNTYDHSMAGWATLFHPDDRAMMTDYFRNTVLGRGQRFDKEYRILRHNDQAERWMHALGRLEFDNDGRPLRMLGTVQDITDRKQAEEERAKLEAQLQQAQKMESVGRLAGGVAHDFNNMLAVILGHAEIVLGETDPAAPLHDDLEEIRKAANRSADLTRQLLAFARRQTIAPKVLDLNETVAGMLKMLQRLIGEDIHLEWHPSANAWAVKMDPSQIDQIVANLCVNARDAIADVGKITIETANKSFDAAYCADHGEFAPGDYVMLAVSDNGCGMDEETLGDIFEPFFTTKGVGEGTGLGLATVYGAVRQNNGFINVYSEPGQGTTFALYLPRYADETESARTQNVLGPLPRGDETILLVEDEAAVLKLTTRLLEGQGYSVLAARTPEEAVRAAREHPGEIHLLLTDVVMPDMNGRDLADRLAPGHPGMRRLFMSGYTANAIAHHGVLDPGVHFIQKPFTAAALAIKVREVLDGK